MLSIHPLSEGFPWVLLIVLFFALASKAQRGGTGRREQWKARMEEMRARQERREAEESAFRDSVLAALRRQNEIAEKQTALLEQLVAERGSETSIVGE